METPTQNAPPVALHRLVRDLLYYWCSHWKWARRMHGGKWEEWWADPCCSYVWLRVDGFHAPGSRPGGCAIYDRDPKPRRREDYSANAKGMTRGLAALEPESTNQLDG